MVTDMDTLFPIFIPMMALTNLVVIRCLIILSCIILIVIGVIIVAWNVMEPTKDFWFNRGLLPVIFVPASLNICLNFTSKTYLQIVTNGVFGVVGLKGLAKMRRFYSEMFSWTFDGLAHTQKLEIKQLCLKADRSIIFMLVFSFWLSAVLAEIQLWSTSLDILKSIISAPGLIFSQIGFCFFFNSILDWVQEWLLLFLCLTILLVGSYFILVPFSMTYFLFLTTIQLMALVYEIEEFQRRIRYVLPGNHNFDNLVQSALEHIIKKHQQISKYSHVSGILIKNKFYDFLGCMWNLDAGFLYLF